MGFLRQSFRVIRAYRQKTILLFIMHLLFSFVLLCGFSVRSTLRDVSERIGEAVEGSVLIQNKQDEREVIDNQVIPADYAEKIKRLSQVKGYEEICRAGVQSQDFMDYLKLSERETYSDHSGNITLIYQTHMLENRIFRDEENTILAGRSLEPEETGKKAVIGRAIAEQENIKVGDRIHVTSCLGKEIGLEIVGISTSDYNGEFFTPQRKASYNHIFTTKEAVCEANGADRLNSIEISLKDCGEAAGFMEEARRLNASGAPVEILPKLDQYHQAVAAVINLEGVVWIVAALSFCMGLLVTALFVSYTLLDRYREIGILISMGMGRGRILLQYGAEILFVLILSDAAAAAAVGAVGGILSGWLTGRMGLEKAVRLSVGAGDMGLLLLCSVLTTTGIGALLVLKITLYKPKELLVRKG